ncbi:MAG: vanadium-dependent haloperoxidase [Bacteroidota bacterium]
MIKSQMRWITFLALLAIFTGACTKDEAFEITNESSTEDFRGNPSAPGDAVENLDNTVVTEWMDLFLDIERYAGGMRPNASARAMAYIALAAYETVAPGMNNYESSERSIQGLNINENDLSNNLDWEIALNTSYADVLAHFLINAPSDKMEGIEVLEENLLGTLSEGVDPERIEASQEWGASVAAQIIAFSQTDTEAEQQILAPQPADYEPPTGEGYWTYSAEEERALFPYWEEVRTFIVATNQTTTRPPIAYSEDPDSRYYQQMLEVNDDNNAARAEDGEALWIAEFWSDDVEDLMFSPPARQFSIANQLVAQYGLDLDESLYLYLKLGFALNDAAVAAWKYKYEHMVMRPNVYIHEFIDPAFQTNLYRLVYWPNPSFPSYPSGHSTFASAAAGVFIDFFGNRTNFTDLSHEGRTEFRGTPRTYTSFRQMADENGYSRIPLGVHMRMDCTEGLRLGYEISDRINRLDLRRGDGRRPR